MKQNKTEYLAFGLFLGIGLLFFIIGLFLTIRELDQTGKVMTTGTITEIRTRHTVDEDEYDVYVSYMVDGVRYENKLNFYSSSYRKGQEVEMYYMEGNPNQIGAKAAQVFVFLFPSLGAIFAIIGGIGIAILVSKKNMSKKLKQSGELVYARFLEARLNTSYSVNHQHPFVILVEWENPEDGVKYVFKSEHIWWDPTYAIATQNITMFPVYINRKNLKEYYVDITEITENLKMV